MDFDYKIPNKVEKIVEKFIEAKAEIFIVGGAVRDVILGLEVKDWDFTTNLTPEEMQKIFPKNSFCNNEFGTFSVVGKDEEIFEITTYRTEQGFSNNRHPDKVLWGKSLSEDLQRRDFTINALALEPIKKTNGYQWKLIDEYKGLDDLSKGIIRTVGNADERFKEDALRMMRAVRIACQIGFLIEEKTFELIQKNKELIKNISGERTRDELFKILLSKRPSNGIRILKNSGLLEYIIPELVDGVEMKQKGHHIDDVWTHNLKALDECKNCDPVTRLAALLHDVGKPKSMRGEGEKRTFHNHEIISSRIANQIAKNLKLSNKQSDKLFRLVRWHMFTTSEMQTDSAVRRFIRNVTTDYLEDMIDVRRADRVGSGAKETSWRWDLFRERLVEVQKQPFSIKDLKINGQDVMKILDIKPGPKVGEILSNIFKKVEEEPSLNDREKLIELVEKEG